MLVANHPSALPSPDLRFCILPIMLVANHPSAPSLLSSFIRPSLLHPPPRSNGGVGPSTSPPHLTGNGTAIRRRCRNQSISASPYAGEPPSAPPLLSASDVVRNFYAGINRHDLAAVEGLIAENCVYEDLIFPRPFIGRQAIMEFFNKFIDFIIADLQFVIDDISDEDSTAVGVTWHLEWRGRPFPFSKGCSFYKLAVVNGVRQIIYARDCSEPALKPGDSALAVIRSVTWLLQQFPQLADRL